MFEPNMKIIELCVTYRCNLKCNNCSNLCSQAPFKGDLLPDDVQFFVNDLINNNHEIEQITIHGGEPVLNPLIFDIIRILVDFREKTGTRLWLLTNHYGDYVQKTIERIREEYKISIGSSEKDIHTKNEFVPVNESPFDLCFTDRIISKEDISQGCYQLNDCGICYNYLGYFPCSPMAAAARVFNYESMGKSIQNLTSEKFFNRALNHCIDCGFALKNRERVVDQTTSEIWKRKLIEYHTYKIESI